MQKSRWSRIAIVAVLLVAMAVTTIVLADNISNKLDASIDAVAEVMPLNVGGVNGTTQLYVQPTGADGKSGCNLTGSTTLVVSVSSSNTSVATVIPSSITFGSCGDTPTLTITPVSQGSATISLSQTSNNSGGSFDLTSATFTVNVAPPLNTAPKVTISGVTGGASYEFGSVPAATCVVTDAEDGNSSFAATLSAITGLRSADGLGAQTASCSYTDAGGLTASDSVTYSIVDTTAPVIAAHADVTAEATSAAGAVVTYTAPATSDAVDGAGTATCAPASGSQFALGNTTVTCNATDTAGNHATATNFKVTVQDTTAPAVSVPADLTAEATGPSGAVVTYSGASASDIVDGALTPTCSPASGSTFGLGANTVTCSATDAAGNTGSKTFTITVVDTTPPSITWVNPISDGASYYFGSVPASPTCTAVDLVSGNVTCTVTGYGTTVGPYKLTATATDAAGNQATKTSSYTVRAWTFGGFYQPVDMGILNNAKAGSTVPLKFEVFAGPTELTDTNIVSSFTQKISCAAGTGDDIETYATGSTTLRYDTVSGQFIFNWQTPKAAGSCYRVTLTTQDRSIISADFRLK